MRCVAMLFLSAAVAVAEPPAKPAKADPAAEAKAEIRARVEKYLAAATPGVFYSEEKDTGKDGQIVRVFVVGTSTISGVLGDEEGAEIARERAEEAAKTEFVKWLGSKVTVRKTTTNEILLTKEGTDTGDGATTKESGKKVERRTKEFEETAGSVVRGLKVAAVHQDPKAKKYILVYRWEAKSAAGAAKVGENLNADPKKPDDTKPEAKKPDDKKPEPKKPNGTLPEKKVIIDD